MVIFVSPLVLWLTVASMVAVVIVGTIWLFPLAKSAWQQREKKVSGTFSAHVSQLSADRPAGRNGS